MHALENVIWQALTTRLAHLSEATGSARRFIPEVSPLAGFSAPSKEGYESLAQLSRPGEIVALFLREPYLPVPGWNLFRKAPLLQMVHENGATPHTEGSQLFDFVTLGKGDLAEMLALVKLTEPGPFNSRTHELGTYLGIRVEGRLAAMAGERLRLPGFTEISAVCTHPDFTGRGYARLLMSELMKRMKARGETPFLHVRQDNLRAIQLYQRLGFHERVTVHLAMLERE